MPTVQSALGPKYLLATPAEPPVLVPAVAVAVHAHPASDAPETELNESPIPIRQLPMRTVRMVVPELRVVLVIGRLRDRVGFESTGFVLRVQFRVSTEVTEIKVGHLDSLVALGRHERERVYVIDELMPTHGIEDLLARTVAVNLDAADDDVQHLATHVIDHCSDHRPNRGLKHAVVRDDPLRIVVREVTHSVHQESFDVLNLQIGRQRGNRGNFRRVLGRHRHNPFVAWCPPSADSLCLFTPLHPDTPNVKMHFTPQRSSNAEM